MLQFIEKFLYGGVTGVKDIPDIRDYPYEYLFGRETDFNNLTETIIDIPDDYQNQNSQEISYYMCVAYSTAHGDNIMNSMDKNPNRTTGLGLGIEMYEKGRLDLKEGALLRDGPLTILERGEITGTSIISTIGGYIHSIDNDRPVVLGSNQINWKETAKTGYAVRGNSFGHCVLGNGYNKEGIICKNTVGNKWGVMNGKFIIKWEDFDLLFYSKISMINNDGYNIFKQIKEIKKMMREDIKKGGFNLYSDGHKKYLKSYQEKKDIDNINYKINRVAWLSLLGRKKIAQEVLKDLQK